MGAKGGERSFKFRGLGCFFILGFLKTVSHLSLKSGARRLNLNLAVARYYTMPARFLIFSQTAPQGKEHVAIHDSNLS